MRSIHVHAVALSSFKVQSTFCRCTCGLFFFIQCTLCRCSCGYCTGSFITFSNPAFWDSSSYITFCRHAFFVCTVCLIACVGNPPIVSSLAVSTSFLVFVSDGKMLYSRPLQDFNFNFFSVYCTPQNISGFKWAHSRGQLLYDLAFIPSAAGVIIGGRLMYTYHPAYSSYDSLPIHL